MRNMDCDWKNKWKPCKRVLTTDLQTDVVACFAPLLSEVPFLKQYCILAS